MTIIITMLISAVSAEAGSLIVSATNGGVYAFRPIMRGTPSTFIEMSVDSRALTNAILLKEVSFAGLLQNGNVTNMHNGRLEFGSGERSEAFDVNPNEAVMMGNNVGFFNHTVRLTNGVTIPPGTITRMVLTMEFDQNATGQYLWLISYSAVSNAVVAFNPDGTRVSAVTTNNYGNRLFPVNPVQLSLKGSTITFTCEPQVAYEVEVSTNLVSWSMMAVLSGNSSGRNTWMDPIKRKTAFYRVRVAPY